MSAYWQGSIEVRDETGKTLTDSPEDQRLRMILPVRPHEESQYRKLQWQRLECSAFSSHESFRRRAQTIPREPGPYQVQKQYRYRDTVGEEIQLAATNLIELRARTARPLSEACTSADGSATRRSLGREPLSGHRTRSSSVDSPASRVVSSGWCMLDCEPPGTTITTVLRKQAR